jgi:hypothetical protein
MFSFCVQETLESQTLGEEGLLGEAAGGQDTDCSVLMQDFGELGDSDEVSSGRDWVMASFSYPFMPPSRRMLCIVERWGPHLTQVHLPTLGHILCCDTTVLVSPFGGSMPHT